MRWAVRLAAARGCRAGAHPSYPDRTGFGRTRMEIPARELTASVTEQIRTLASVAAESGVRLTHVKPHGALYHEASADEAVARAVFEAARDSGLSLRLVGAAGSRAVRWWGAWGAAVIEEGFMDRVYEPDGSLRSRSRAGALIESTEVAAAQAVSLACGGAVTASDGLAVSVAARTLCVHADTPGAVALARGVVEALSRAGVAVRAHDR